MSKQLAAVDFNNQLQTMVVNAHVAAMEATKQAEAAKDELYKLLMPNVRNEEWAPLFELMHQKEAVARGLGRIYAALVEAQRQALWAMDSPDASACANDMRVDPNVMR